MNRVQTYSRCRRLVLFVFPIVFPIVAIGLAPGNSRSAPFLYSVSPIDSNLRLIDAVDGSTVQVIPLSGPGADQMTGLAIDPTSQGAADPETWAAYGIARTGDGVARNLVTINLVTGATTIVGNTGVAMAGLTFAPDGTLYGVSGDGGPAPNESLFTVSKLDGSAALLGSMGAGGDGEAIGYNSDDGLIYHFSGLRETEPIGREIFESINPANGATVTTILPEGTPDAEEGLALLYRGGGEFYASFLREDSDPTVGENLFAIIDTAGTVTKLGHFDHRSKGLAFAFVPEPSCLAMLLPSLLGITLFRRRFVRTPDSA